MEEDSAALQSIEEDRKLEGMVNAVLECVYTACRHSPESIKQRVYDSAKWLPGFLEVQEKTMECIEDFLSGRDRTVTLTDVQCRETIHQLKKTAILHYRLQEAYAVALEKIHYEFQEKPYMVQ